MVVYYTPGDELPRGAEQYPPEDYIATGGYWYPYARGNGAEYRFWMANAWASEVAPPVQPFWDQSLYRLVRVTIPTYGGTGTTFTWYVRTPAGDPPPQPMPPAPPPAPPGENLFDSLRNVAIAATNALVAATLDANANIFLRPLVGVLNAMSTGTSQLAGYLYDASNWYNQVTSAINRALSWDGIKAAVLEWLPWLPTAADWFGNVAGYIHTYIAAWWEGAKTDVLTWLGAAREEVIGWLAEYASLEYLGSWWTARTDEVLGWLQSTRDDLLDAVEAVAAPIRAEVNRHTAVIELLTDPGDAALRWLQERIERMIVRLW